MARKNSQVVLGEAVNTASAGPGHKPTSPHPTPNRTGPKKRRGSISLPEGSENSEAK